MVMPCPAVPPVIKAMLFAPIRYSPLSVSSVKANPGAEAVPSEISTTPEKEGEDLAERVIDPPSETVPPPVKLVPAVTVTAEFDRAELGILVKVLALPERDLLVKVWVVSVPTRVVVAPGRVN